MNEELLNEIKYEASGLIPAIVQDAETKEVLMMAWMNAESLQMTMETGETVFWSRSRKELWHKGATSGNIQNVVEVKVEVAQALAPTGREFSMLDEVANALGAGLGTAAALMLRR